MGSTRRGRVRTPVLEIAYEEAGPPDGPVAVLSHGFPYDVRAYDEVADLQAAITQGTSIGQLDLSCFTGEYVTGTVTEEYLEWVEKTQLS